MAWSAGSEIGPDAKTYLRKTYFETLCRVLTKVSCERHRELSASMKGR